MAKSYSLSVIVIAKNEEDRIERCLSSIVDLADEVIVLDSGSDDATVDIAKKYATHVEVTDWPGYGLQKQRALDKASSEWVLSLDADEEVTEELRDEIEYLLNNGAEYSAYKVQWAEVILGKQLNYGMRSRYVLRLFKREGAKFTDWIVHEKVLLPKSTKIGKLKARLKHYSVRDFESLMHKNDSYALLMARRKYRAGKTGGGLPGAFARSMFVFFQVYVLRCGFLDGGRGLLMAVMQSQYTFNKYAGVWFMRKMEK